MIASNPSLNSNPYASRRSELNSLMRHLSRNWKSLFLSDDDDTCSLWAKMDLGKSWIRIGIYMCQLIGYMFLVTAYVNMCQRKKCSRKSVKGPSNARQPSDSNNPAISCGEWTEQQIRSQFRAKQFMQHFCKVGTVFRSGILRKISKIRLIF